MVWGTHISGHHHMDMDIWWYNDMICVVYIDSSKLSNRHYLTISIINTITVTIITYHETPKKMTTIMKLQKKNDNHHEYIGKHHELSTTWYGVSIVLTTLTSSFTSPWLSPWFHAPFVRRATTAQGFQVPKSAEEVQVQVQQLGWEEKAGGVYTHFRKPPHIYIYRYIYR